MQMNERHEFQGEWWLPEQTEEKLSGMLTCDPDDGITLDLIGYFTKHQGLCEPDIILGRSTTGKKITLYGCLEARRTIGLNGIGSSSFRVEIALINCHFSKAKELRFKNLFVNYSHLEEWIGGGKFKEREDEKDGVRRYCLQYEEPTPARARTDDFKLYFSYQLHPSGDRVRELKLTHATFIVMERQKELDLEEYLGIFGHVQNFLSLAVRRAVHPQEIFAMVERSKNVARETGPSYVAEIYYPVRRTGDSPRRLIPSDMLFTFARVSERFEAHVRSWFDKLNVLRPVYELFFGVLYSPSMYVSLQFLSYAQAIETFHRRTRDGTELPEPDHNIRIKEILNAAPSIHKHWLVEKLKYSNELSLRKRLSDIITDCSQVLGKYIPDGRGFVNKVVKTRNYLTHYTEESRTGPAQGTEELFHLTQKLRIVLEVLLLRQAGFSLEEIESLGSHNRDWQFWMQKP